MENTYRIRERISLPQIYVETQVILWFRDWGKETWEKAVASEKETMSAERRGIHKVSWAVRILLAARNKRCGKNGYWKGNQHGLLHLINIQNGHCALLSLFLLPQQFCPEAVKWNWQCTCPCLRRRAESETEQAVPRKTGVTFAHGAKCVQSEEKGFRVGRWAIKEFRREAG